MADAIAELEFTRAEAHDVPEALRASRDEQGAELEALGFEALSWMRASDATASDEPPTYAKWFRHAEPVAYALATDEGFVFLSVAEDGRKLATAAFARREWEDLPNHTWTVSKGEVAAELWQEHQDALASETDFEPRDGSADELIAEWSDSARRATEHMVESGRWTRDADGRLRPRASRRWVRMAMVASCAGAALSLALVWFASRPDAPAPVAKPAPRPALARPAAPKPAAPAPPAVQPAAARAVANPPRLTPAELDRALDQAEQKFGFESLEVAQVLESFPKDVPRSDSERAAALVRQMRLIGIYEKAQATDPARAADLERARATLASLRSPASSPTTSAP